MGTFALQSRLCGEAIIRNAYQQTFPLVDGPYVDQSWPVRCLRQLVKWMGLHRRAQRNFETIVVRKHEIRVPASKKKLSKNLRILHVTDLHIDFDPGVLDRLEEALRGLSYDMVALTGDFNDLVIEERHAQPEWYERLGKMFRAPVFAVLGNHDFLWTVDSLEKNGIRVLLNEGLLVGTENNSIYLAGVDDPRMFRSENLESALKEYDGQLPLVLLAHAPQIYREALSSPVDLILCGHTHGGQVCWPGGLPLINRFSCPRALVSGYWRMDPLQGYTSNGCGGCKLPYRLNAPAEITLFTLRTEEPLVPPSRLLH